MIQYLHNLRGLAIFLVVLLHSIYIVPMAFREDYSIIFVLNNATYLFVVIAGYFFAMLVGKYTYYKYLRAKIDNVILPYFFVSIPAILIYLLGFKHGHSWLDIDALLNGSYIWAVAVFYVTGAHLGPLWFIPMIVIFYVAFPFFRLVLRSDFIVFALFFVSLFLGFLYGRPEDNNNSILSFNYFLSAYVFGFILYRKKPHELISSATAFLLFLMVLVIYSLVFDGGYSYSYDLLMRPFFCISIFSLFYWFFNKRIVVLGFLGDRSFYIFFVHGYFVAAFRMIDLEINTYFLALITFCLVSLGTILSYFLVKFVFRSNTKRLFGTD